MFKMIVVALALLATGCADRGHGWAGRLMGEQAGSPGDGWAGRYMGEQAK